MESNSSSAQLHCIVGLIHSLYKSHQFWIGVWFGHSFVFINMAVAFSWLFVPVCALSVFYLVMNLIRFLNQPNPSANRAGQG